MNFDKDYAVDVTKPWHVAYWAAILGIDDKEVVKAVEAVGASLQAVRAYLRSQATSVTAGDQGVAKMQIEDENRKTTI